MSGGCAVKYYLLISQTDNSQNEGGRALESFDLLINKLNRLIKRWLFLHPTPLACEI